MGKTRAHRQAEICSSGAEATGAISWQKYLNGNCDKLPDSKWTSTKMINPGGHLLKRGPQLSGLHLHSHQAITLKRQEKNSLLSQARRGENELFQMLSEHLHNKGLLSRGNTSWSCFSARRRGSYPTPVPAASFPFLLKLGTKGRS